MSHFTKFSAKLLTASALCAMALAVSVSAADTEMAVAVGATTGSSLRLRAEASTESSVITTLDKHIAVAILDGSTDDFYRINYNGKTGYVSSDYIIVDKDNEFDCYGRIVTDSVNVRSEANTSCEVVAVLDQDDYVSVTGLDGAWYSVETENGTEGYIRSDFVTLTDSKDEPVSYSSSNSSVVDYAKQFLGVHYVYGGASPSGFDCSGFTMYVYSHFGVDLPHSATSQWQSGKGFRVYNMSDLQAGNLVFFNDPSRNAGKACSHTGIYIGGGKFIHASSSRSGGVVISDITSGYYATYFVGGLAL